MRVKHPTIKGLDRTLRPSQVESWLSAGWLPVDAPEPAPEPVEAIAVDEEPAVEAVPSETPETSRKRQPRKG